MADINDIKNRTVSHGTLNPDHLIPAFCDVLKEYAPEKYAEFIKDYPELDGWEEFLEADWRLVSNDTKMNASDELFGLLNDIAPEGTMFSSTEGDGSDFGFWTVEEKKSEADDDNKDLRIGLYYTEEELAILKDIFKKYVQEISGIRYSVPEDYTISYEISDDPLGDFEAVVKATGKNGKTIYLCNLHGEVLWAVNTPKQFWHYVGQVDPKTGEEKKDKYVIPPRSFFLDDEYYDNVKPSTRIPLNPSDWDKVDDYFKRFFKKRGEGFLDDDEGEKALKQMAKDGKSTGEVAADIRYDVATALDMAADKAEDLMTKFGLDKIYVLRAKGLSPKAIAKKILKADDGKSESKKNENLTDKEEHEWYRFWFDDVKKHIVPGKSGSVEHNCKMLPYSDVRQMWGVAAMAKELCDNFRRYLSYRGYTNSKGSPFAEISWRAEDAGDLLTAMNKADGTSIGKSEAALRPWRTDFEKDLQKRIDDAKGTKYDTKDFTADGWEFVTGDVYDDGSEYGSNGKDVAVAFFKREHAGQYYRMWLAFDPDTKEITGGKWWIESDESKDERRDSADYLLEVWDALVSVWDKEKFDMAKGYDDEYECEAITIVSKDNEGVRAKIYVDDHEGKHPVGFDVIYRYPGDKGVGDLGYYEFQSTDFDETAPEIFAYFDELKGKVSEAKGDNWVAYYFCEDPQGLEWAVLPHAINGIGNASCVNSRGGNDSIAIEYVLDECTPIEDVKGSDIYGKVKDFEDRNIVALTRDEAERIAIADDRLEMLKSVVAGKDESCKREATGVAAIYGDGDVSTHENSADGFYVDEHDPMGFAVLNNDTATMKELFSGKAVAPEKPWTYAGWHEDTDAPENKDGSYPYVYDWEREYDLNFVNDWKRVVGDKDNEEALELLLKYAPDFIPSAMDFWNAFHAGYSKGLLRKLFNNIFAVVDKDDPNNNYLGYEDYTYDEVAKFLDGKDEAADSRRVDDYANMRFFDPEEFVKYVRKAYGKDGGYVSIDSVVPVSVLNKANRMAQKNGYSKLESKKSESLTLKQKELKDMARYGEAEDITTISDAEAKELKKKGIETVGVSRGTYGMNGALLRDREGNKYVITARSSNLFYFV